MKPWLRILAAWLLAVALPLQGAAAAAMIHCGPSHERMAPTAGAAPAAALAHPAGHPCADTAGSDTSPEASADLAGYQCSACAACCAASALPATSVSFATPPLAHTIAPPPGALPSPYVTGGLDRPPRTGG